MVNMITTINIYDDGDDDHDNRNSSRRKKTSATWTAPYIRCPCQDSAM